MPGVAYAFTLNMIIGCGKSQTGEVFDVLVPTTLPSQGVLGLPFAFYHGGVVMSAILLGVLSILAFSTMMFVVETLVSAPREEGEPSESPTPPSPASAGPGRKLGFITDLGLDGGWRHWGRCR
jgi:hypothetical protein